MSIKLLCPELRNQLRSGVAISSPTQCIEELVLNSIDSNSTCVAVRIGDKFDKIQVIDNGDGISKDDLQVVGQRYFTSKCHRVEDLANLCQYGYRGEALSSIADISTSIEIQTRYSDKTFSKSIERGKSRGVTSCKTVRPSRGTTITVRGLFYNQPVRAKRLNQSLEIERVRERLESIALINYTVSLSLRNDSLNAVLIQIRRSNSLLGAFRQMYGASLSDPLKAVSLTDENMKISGFISGEGHGGNSLQFVYVNRRLVLKSKIHTCVNYFLSKSLIVRPKVDERSRDIAEPKPIVYREYFPVFVIMINCPVSSYDVTFNPSKTLVEFHNWSPLVESLAKMIDEFLKSHDLTGIVDKIEESNESSSDGNISKESTHLNSESACDEITTLNVTNCLHSNCVRRMIFNKENQNQSPNIEQVEVTEDKDEVTKIPKNLSDEVLEVSGELDSDEFCHLETSSPSYTYSSTAEVDIEDQEKCDDKIEAPMVPLENDSITLPQMNEYSFCTTNSGRRLTLTERLARLKKSTDESSKIRLPSNIEKTIKTPSSLKKRVCKMNETLKGGVDQSNNVLKTPSVQVFKGTKLPPPIKRRKITSPELEQQQKPSYLHSLIKEIGDAAIQCNARHDQDKSSNVPPKKFKFKPELCRFDRDLVNISDDKYERKMPNTTSRGIAKTEGDTEYCFEELHGTGHVKVNEGLDYVASGIGNTRQGNIQYLEQQRHSSVRNVCDHFSVGKPSLVRCSKSTNEVHFINDMFNKGKSTESIDNDYKKPKACNVDNLASVLMFNNMEGLSEKAVLKNVAQESETWPDEIQNEESVPHTELQRKEIPPKVIRKASEKCETKSHVLLNTQEFQPRSLETQPFEMLDGNYRDHIDCMNQKIHINQIPELSIENENRSLETRLDEDAMSNVDKVSKEDDKLPINTSVGNTSDNIEFSGNTWPWEKPDDSLILQTEQSDVVNTVVGVEHSCSDQVAVKWTTRIDSTTGKTIYVNLVSGNSSFEPPRDLKKDISEVEDTAGVGFTQHPFLSHDAAPLMPRSKTERQHVDLPYPSALQPLYNEHRKQLDSERDIKWRINETGHETSSVTEKGIDLMNLFENWENPVFSAPEKAILDIGATNTCSLRTYVSSQSCRFNKEMLLNPFVIQQVDNKFIACLLQADNKQSDHSLLTLIDQHAADERVRLEQLTEGVPRVADISRNEARSLAIRLFQNGTSMNAYRKGFVSIALLSAVNNVHGNHGQKLRIEVDGQSYIRSSDITPTLQLQLNPAEIRILKGNQDHFIKTGVKITRIHEEYSTINVTAVPSCFIENLDLSATSSYVKVFIKEEIEMIQKTGGANKLIPQSIFKFLCSKACHGAIKFGDEMTRRECESLIRLLSKCKLPFQCAHGRPSIVPIIDLNDLTRKLQPFQVKKPPKLWKIREKLEQA